MHFPEGPSRRLRLGGVDWPEAAPLLSGLSSDADVEFELATPEQLVARLADGSLDAALLPPLHAWQLPGTRLVPGISLSRRHDFPATADEDAEPSAACEVLLVWACRHHAPYPDIRRRLVLANRVANLPPGQGDFTYGLGSAESDFLRALIGILKRDGLLDASADLFYC